MKREPWDVRDDESAAAYDAFRSFIELGPERTHPRLVSEMISRAGNRKQTGGIKRSIERWSGRHDWHERAKAWDNHLASRRRAELAREHVIAARRHAQEMRQAAVNISLVGEAFRQRLEREVGVTVTEDGDLVDEGPRLIDAIAALPPAQLVALQLAAAKVLPAVQQAERLALGMTTEIIETRDDASPAAEPVDPQDAAERVLDVVDALEESGQIAARRGRLGIPHPKGAE